MAASLQSYKKPVFKQSSTRQPKNLRNFKNYKEGAKKLLTQHMEIATWFSVKLYQNNVNLTLL